MKLPFVINLSNKVAVVTGAGGVLCSLFAQAIAACGAKVALLDINEAAAQTVANAIAAQGYTAKAYQCDVLDKTALERCHAQILADFGACDILLNGAGGNNPRATTDRETYQPGDVDADTKSFFNLEPEDISFVFNLNFLGTLLPVQVFSADMAKKPGGTIVNISSMNALTPLTKIPAYSAAKAAISNFTQWLAVHFAPAEIRVNAIAPGFFATTQNHSLLFDADGAPSARTGKILTATPMGRLGKAEELVGTLLWLISNEASGFVTGVVVPVDGGFSAYSGV